jgi:PAT family beta-lactamase induction signal transducer AmpG
LYLTEGIPVGFATVALAAYLRRRGAGLDEVGAISAAVYAPWGFKWAWAPVVDLIRSRWLGPNRAWILAAQTMMILTLAALLSFDPAANIALLTTLIVVHNVFAATQDVAIDAMAVRVLPASEVGTANGFMFGAQFAGIGLGGSGAMFVADAFGFTASFYFILGLLALLLLLVTIPLREPPDPPPDPQEAKSAGSALAAILTRLKTYARELGRGFFRSGRAPALGVVFSILPPAAVALGLGLSTAMQVDLKMSEQAIGALALATNVAGALGAITGGWISDRTGSPRACIAVFYALTAVPTALLAARFTSSAGMAGLTVPLFVAATVSYNLFYGMQQGTVTGLFMRVTNPAVAATQFTGYMALHNLAVSYSSLWQGRISQGYGYATMLYLDAALAFAALTVLPFMDGRRQS